MDLVNLALVQKAVRDAHVDHIGPPGPKGDKGDKGDPLTWDDLTEEQKASLKGADGKSAYEYAVEGGYTGTETAFAEKLAQEIPTVDSTLTQNGQAADAAKVGDRLSVLSEEIAEIPQSDWNQNDSTAADYIKNRPFYYSEQNETLELCKVNASSNSALTTINSKEVRNLVIGFDPRYNRDNAIEITLSNATFGSKTYTLTKKTGDVTAYTSPHYPPVSTSEYYGDMEFEEYPFCILLPTTNGHYMVADVLTSKFGTGSVGVIIKQTSSQSTLVKLDEKFIPDTFARTDSVMSNSNPTATGSFSMGRKPETTVGYCSHTEGYNTVASAPRSHAEGGETKAYGGSSHAEGQGSTAFGENSHAEGQGSTASGTCSHAEGYGTTASGGSPTHAEGSGTTASGSVAHAEGQNTTASGLISHAEGYHSTASKAYTHAEGEGTTASAEAAHAEGRGSTSSGVASHAEGDATTASGESAHSEGFHAKASASYAHAEGYYTAASGKAAHSEGSKLDSAGRDLSSRTIKAASYPVIGSSDITVTSSTAQGISSHAEGVQTLAFGYASHAEGDRSDALGARSHAEGGSSASGDYSHAEGFGSVSGGYCSHAEGSYGVSASGNSSHAEGTGTTASGNYSHAEGAGTNASGNYSHAEGGSGVVASGESSHAEGRRAVMASGDASHAEGQTTRAVGEASHAEGWVTVASGNYSHAEGDATTASGANQHVQGKYNIDDTESTYAHIVGNGTSDTERSNAHTLDWSGNAWYAGSVYVGGDETNYNPETAKKLATEEYVQNLIGAVDELLGSGVLS